MRRVVALVACLAVAGCGEDEDPAVALDVNAVAAGGGDVVVNLYNEGRLGGVVLGCPSGPMTAVERWDGSAFVYWTTLNDDCLSNETVEYELARHEQIEYTLSLPTGRYRFTVTLRVDGHFGEGTSTSKPVDV